MGNRLFLFPNSIFYGLGWSEIPLVSDLGFPLISEQQ